MQFKKIGDPAAGIADHKIYFNRSLLFVSIVTSLAVGGFFDGGSGTFGSAGEFLQGGDKRVIFLLVVCGISLWWFF